METIKYNSLPCISLDSLWNALHSSFNNALDCQVDISILDEIGNKPISSWSLFSKEESKITTNSCNNLSTLGLDKLSWNHLKSVLKHEDYLLNIIGIVNTYINLGYWPNYFKKLTTIIIPKPNKLLQSQELKVVQVKEPCIGFTQENSIKNSI